MSSARVLKSGPLLDESSSFFSFLSARRKKQRHFILFARTKDSPAILSVGAKQGTKDGEFDLSTLTAVHVSNRDLFLTIGSRVFVQKHGYGVLKYWGYHHLYRKEIVGVELDNAIPDTAASKASAMTEDDNHHYFRCKAGHGIIISPEHVVPVQRTSGAAIDLSSIKDFAFQLSFSKGTTERTHEFFADSFATMQGWVFAVSKAALQSAPVSAWERVLARGGNDSPLLPAARVPETGRTRNSGELSVCPWFHPGLSREEVESMIQQCGARDGLFCVRPSASQPDKLVISVCCNKTIQHYLILASPNDLNGTSKLDVQIGSSKVVVKDFYDLINLLRKDQQDLEWETPLSAFVTYDKSLGLHTARAVPLDEAHFRTQRAENLVVPGRASGGAASPSLSPSPAASASSVPPLTRPASQTHSLSGSICERFSEV